MYNCLLWCSYVERFSEISLTFFVEYIMHSSVHGHSKNEIPFSNLKVKLQTMIKLLHVTCWSGFKRFDHLRNEFNFWNVHGIMNTSGLVQSKWSPKGFTLTLQETRSIHDSMNIPKIEFITYIYILYYQSSINFQLSSYLAGFPDIWNYIRHNVGFGIAKTPNFRTSRHGDTCSTSRKRQ